MFVSKALDEILLNLAVLCTKSRCEIGMRAWKSASATSPPPYGISLSPEMVMVSPSYLFVLQVALVVRQQRRHSRSGADAPILLHHVLPGNDTHGDRVLPTQQQTQNHGGQGRREKVESIETYQMDSPSLRWDEHSNAICSLG